MKGVDMKLKKIGLCRGDGKLYIKIRTSEKREQKDLSVQAEYESATFPANIYPVGTEAQTDTWVIEAPIIDAPTIRIKLLEKGAETGFLSVNYTQAKWESRFNYRLRKQLCSEIRDFERVFTQNRYQIRILRFLENDSCVTWRLQISWQGDTSLQPTLKALDGKGQNLTPEIFLFETQEATRPTENNNLFLSVEIPTDITFFSLIATDPSPINQIQSGFCSINPTAYEAFKYASWNYMKDARADDKAYLSWLETHQASSNELAQQAKTVLDNAPLISVITPCYLSDKTFLRELARSLMCQSYANWELLLLDASPHQDTVKSVVAEMGDTRIKYKNLTDNRGIVANTNAGIAAAKGDFVAFLDHDDLLEPDALFRYAEAITNNPSIDVLFCDEDLFEHKGSYKQPVFKTPLNLDLLYSHNCVTHFLAIKRTFLLEIGLSDENVSGAQDYDLVLRAFASGGTFQHIPRILYHWRIHENSTSADGEGGKPYAEEAGRLALSNHFEQRSIKASVTTTQHPYVYRVRYELPDPLPLVSIIIPSKDHADILKDCITSIMEKSTYGNFEILIIENNSTEKATFDCYTALEKSDPRVRIITWQNDFNYSQIINFGAANARGEYLLLLNNDTKVISPDFIEEMMGYLQRPEVGVVGAKLYFRDKLTQHAGILVGPHDAIAHVNQDFPKTREGYLGKAVRPGNFSAVTGACQMVRKKTFDTVNGYDEKLAVGFNDADFCLRLIKAGHRVVFTPYAELFHYEFVSRGREIADSEKQKRWERERDLFMSRWENVFIEGDPFTNPNLDRNSAYYGL